ncbi:MAG: sigma-70 family RNA polymerase sigma factor [bacterium]
MIISHSNYCCIIHTLDISIYFAPPVNPDDSGGVVAVEGDDLMAGVEQSDALLVRIAAGDAEAFAALLAQYGALIERHLLGMVRDANTAADLTQETFLRVWLHAEQWDGRGNCKGWLLRIATNLTLNHLRSVRRRHELPLELTADADDETYAPGWLVDEVTGNPQAWLEARERQALLHQLVQELPEEKRDVLRLVYTEDMDIRQAAETLGIPEGTIKSRLHHARKYLARRIKEEEY